MATPDQTQNATPTPAPAAQPTASPVIPASPAPDLSALTSPAQAGPNPFTDPGSPIVKAQDAATTAYTNAQKLAAQPTIPPNAPHAKLLSMVNALAIGLSSFGTAVATHGQEGGAKEVAEIQAEQQNEKLQAQQAAQAQRDHQIQNQLTIGQTNEALVRSYINLMTMPDDLEAKHFDVENAKLGVISGTQDIRSKALQDLIQTGDVNGYNTTLSQIGGATGAPAGTATGAVTPAAGTANAAAPASGSGTVSSLPPAALATWKNSVDAATEAYPDDPQIKNYASTLADPSATPQQLAMAATGAKNRMNALDAGAESRTKQNAAQAGSVYAKLSSPEALALPGAQASISAAIDNPSTPSTDIPKLIELIPQAYAAQANADAIKKRQAVADEAVKEGDPNAAGELLANRQTTISELKSRGMTPQFITNAINAATKIDPKYNAVAEDNFAKTAGSEQNQAFFGNVGSLIAPGGTLDQLQDAGKGLSQSDLQILNKTKNWYNLQVGQGGISAAAAKIVGVADDYAKVMGGSTGSDAARSMVLKIIDMSQSPAQRTASIQAMKDSVKSQADARIGNNPWLKLEYGSLVTPAAPAAQVKQVVAPPNSPASRLHANLTDFTHAFSGKNGTIYSDDGKTWFDSNGNLVGSR